MAFTEIDYGSVLYQKTLKLREDILRKPLGLALDPEDLFGEDSQFHFAMIEDETLAACVVVKPLSPVIGKLRQMAVAEQSQGTGLGRALVSGVEASLIDKGFHTLQLSARHSAVGFYRKLDYSTLGDFYLEQGIDHIAMQKSLLTTVP